MYENFTIRYSTPKGGSGITKVTTQEQAIDKLKSLFKNKQTATVERDRETVGRVWQNGNKWNWLFDTILSMEIGKRLQDFSNRVRKAQKDNDGIIIVNDNDNEAWDSGFANYLISNFQYSNFKTGYRVNVNNTPSYR